jgi:hypothetical protein
MTYRKRRLSVKSVPWLTVNLKQQQQLRHQSISTKEIIIRRLRLLPLLLLAMVTVVVQSTVAYAFKTFNEMSNPYWLTVSQRQKQGMNIYLNRYPINCLRGLISLISIKQETRHIQSRSMHELLSKSISMNDFGMDHTMHTSNNNNNHHHHHHHHQTNAHNTVRRNLTSVNKIAGIPISMMNTTSDTDMSDLSQVNDDDDHNEDGDGEINNTSLAWDNFEYSQSPKVDKRFGKIEYNHTNSTTLPKEELLHQLHQQEALFDQQYAKVVQTQNELWMSLQSDTVQTAITYLQSIIQSERIHRIQTVLQQRTNNVRFLFESKLPSNKVIYIFCYIIYVLRYLLTRLPSSALSSFSNLTFFLYKNTFVIYIFIISGRSIKSK